MKNTVFVLWLGLAVADIGWAQNEPYKNLICLLVNGLRIC